MSTPSDGAVLVTGFPAFLAKRMLATLLAHDAQVLVLVQEKFVGQARQFVRRLPLPVDKKRVEFLIGDTLDMDLGLSGREIAAMLPRVSQVHHLAAAYYPGVATEYARRVNVEGTRETLAMALRMPNLARFNHYSTAFVCGDRTGVVLEDELDLGQRFGSAIERTKFEAERLVQAALGDLPISVFRPSIVLGDSKTGQIDPSHGPFQLLNTIVNLPLDIRVPLPGRGAYPLNLVPVDYVVAAALYISRHPEGAGRTYHLTDPNPLSARMVYDLVADAADRKRPRISAAAEFARWLLRIPGLARGTQATPYYLELVNRLLIFNCRNTLAILAGSGIRCPGFDGYVDRLVSHLRRMHAEGGSKGES